MLAVNEVGTFTGNLADYQSGGVSRCSIAAVGTITVTPNNARAATFTHYQNFAGATVLLQPSGSFQRTMFRFNNYQFATDTALSNTADFALQNNTSGTFIMRVNTGDQLTLGGGTAATNGVVVGVASGFLAFYGGTPVVKATVTGSKGANAALSSLMTALSGLGLVTDSTT